MKFKFTGLCLVFTALFSPIGFGEVIYNGESHPFMMSAKWDSNGSALVQKSSSASSFSAPNYLSANINVKNWWGSVAYVPANWKEINLSKALYLQFAIKSSNDTSLIIQLYDSNKVSSRKETIKVSKVYSVYSIPMEQFSGIDPYKIQAIVFAVSEVGTPSYTIDIDNIETIDDLDAKLKNQSVRQKGKELANYFMGSPNFMIGSVSLAKEKNIKTDIQYRYLSQGWEKWNSPDGYYADMVIRAADEQGAVPMFTYYDLAFNFEKKNYGVLTSEELHKYLLNLKTLFSRVAIYNKPVILHLEPDFFGYLQQYADKIKTPAHQIAAKIKYNDLKECSPYPENIGGMFSCIIDMSRNISPKMRMGYHASTWGDSFDANVPGQVVTKAQSVGNFLKSLGSDKTDFVVVETSDRDAGYIEATTGAKNAYWTDKDFQNHLLWVDSLTKTISKPALWWQMPFGVPSNTPGGTDGRYRDNRVQMFFGNVLAAVNAGGFAMAYGAGADKQTTPDSDDGQFKRAVDNYRKTPVSL